MRLSSTPRVCSGLLCGLLVLLAGCGSPSSQNLASLTVTATPSSIPVGGAAVLKAVAHLSDGTTQDVSAGTQWTVSNPALATINNGALTAKAVGTLTLQAAYLEITPAGKSPASTTVTPQNLSASTQLAITPDGGPTNIPVITWSAPAAIAYGTALSGTQLNATANVPGTFTYAPAAGTILKQGAQTLSTTFMPTDKKNYSAATATVALTVNQATPVVTWATPAPIAPGTALSAAQLDATADVPGSFVYNPALGAVLSAGTKILTAVFSPADATTYSSVTATTSIVVGSATGGPGPAPPPVGCGGPTINLNGSMSQSTLQSSIANAPVCSLVLFAAGTYNISSTLTLKCGVTYAGPAVPLVNGLVTPSAILSGSSMAVGNHIFALWSSLSGNPCTQQTLIEYLNFSGNSGISVQSPFTNLLIQYNAFTNIPGSQGQTDAAAFASANGGTNSNAVLTNTMFTHNIVGDMKSCISPTNVMADTNSPEDYEGACNGLVFQTSIDGFTMTNNNLIHVAEGVHINCPNYAHQQYECEPPGGAVTKNLTVEYNDFAYIHRIPWEEQAQQTAGVVFQYNSEHDWENPYFGSFGTSFACCYNGTSAPYLNVSSNVIIFNVPPTHDVRYGYGTEGMGHNATYANNYLAAADYPVNSRFGPAPGIVFGCGPVANMNNNTVVGNWNQAYVVNEGIAGCGTDSNPANLTGNVTGSKVSTMTSVAPTISPAAAAYNFPLTVTLTDDGYTSGAVPQSNTGIWYTTDGSTPVPGAGTALYLASGSSFVLTAPATVKAVGMWGAVNQPTAYASGFGFVPSGVVSSAFSGSSPARQPAGKANSSRNSARGSGSTLESVTISPSQPVVGVGSKQQLKAIATFDDGSVRDVTADFAWQSSDERNMTASRSGMLSGVASGTAKVSGRYGGLAASISATATIGEIVWAEPIVITAGGTYSGNWQSNDPTIAAVTVATTDPVTIENSHMRSASNLIATKVPGSNLSVRNSLGVALNAGVKGQANGNFVEVSAPARLDVENNYVENARGGVIVHGYGGSRNGEQTIVIRGNRARNLNGLLSDGKGGHLARHGSSLTPAHFIGFDSVQSVPRIDVGWNEVVNYPGQSLVDENIDLYRSGGTPNQPLEIHDTYIQGAYPNQAEDAYAGGGIATRGTPTDSAEQAPAFNYIHDNQVIATVNHGIRFAAGHDNIASNNRVISSGLLADGTQIAAQDVGLANGEAGAGAIASGSMYNNIMRDNLIGWTCWQSACAQQGYRKDQSFPAAPADYSSNSVVERKQITLDMENSEYQVWMNKMATAAIAVGPSF